MVYIFIFPVSFHLDFLNFCFFVQNNTLTIDSLDRIMLEVIITEHMRSFVCNGETIFILKDKCVNIQV